jgi:hypothetical protein
MSRSIPGTVHIASPVTTLNSHLTLCGEWLADTNWVCFEGNGDYSASDCETCVKEAQHRRSVSALARDKVAALRGQQ